MAIRARPCYRTAQQGPSMRDVLVCRVPDNLGDGYPALLCNTIKSRIKLPGTAHSSVNCLQLHHITLRRSILES